MYDELSFGKAFKKAMREKGSGNTFTWRGKLYLLGYKDEALNKKHNTPVNTTVKEPLGQQEVSTEPVVEKNVEQPLINSNQRQQLLEQPLFRSPTKPEVKSLFDEITIGKEYVSKTDGKKDSVKAANDSLQAYEKLGDVEIVKNKDGSIKTDKDGSFMYIPKTTTFVDRMNEEIRRINSQQPSFDFSKMSEANRSNNTTTAVETEKPIENTKNPEEKSFFSDVVESVGDFFEQGVNYVNRHFLDDTEVQTKGITIPVQQNKPVILTENPRVFNDNINVIKELPLSSHDGYAMSGVVNLNKNKFVARNREDLTGVDKGKGVLVTTFRPFETDKNKLQRYSDILAVKKDSTVQIMPRNEFNQTKDIISGSGIDRMPFDKIETKIINGVEHVRTQPTDDFNGRVVSMGSGYNSGIGVERGRDSEEWVPVNQANKFSSLMGGKVLMKVGDQQIIVSGSFKDMNDAYKELSKKTGKTPEVYKIDNGSFNLPYFKGGSGITSGDLKKHQNRNNKGGHSLILVNKYQGGGKVGYDEEYFYDFSNAVDTENNFSQTPVSENGLWEYPNREVIVPTNGSITMKGVDYPVVGTSMETGESRMMYPNEEHFFENTQNVYETPQFQYGGIMSRNIVNSNRVEETTRDATPLDILKSVYPNYIPQKTDVESLRSKYKDYDLYNLQKVMNIQTTKNTPQATLNRIQVAKELYDQRYGGERGRKKYMYGNYSKPVEDDYYNKYSKMADQTLLNRFRELGKHKGSYYTHQINALGRLLDERKINPITGESGLQIPTKYQNGGQVVQEDKVKQFIADMIQSNWYEERLKNNGYKNPEKTAERRLNNVKQTGLLFNENEPTHFYREKLMGKQVGKPYVSYNTNQIDEEDGDYNGVLAHEYGHGETTIVPLSNFERIQIQKRFNLDDIGQMSEYGLYMSSPEEAKGDINGIRYQLFEQGRFNPKTGEYDTPSKLFEPSLLKGNQDLQMRRMEEAYGEQGLTELMNIIAQNNNNEEEYNTQGYM